MVTAVHKLAGQSNVYFTHCDSQWSTSINFFFTCKLLNNNDCNNKKKTANTTRTSGGNDKNDNWYTLDFLRL